MTSVRIYSLGSEVEKYRWLRIRESAVEPLEWAFEGESLANEWKAPLLEEFDAPDLPKGPMSDFPYAAAGVPIMTVRAARALEPLLSGNGEFLPVRCACGEFVIFNVTRILDVLDEEQSEIERFTDSGRVMTIKRFAFLPAGLGTHAIFKIPQKPAVLVLVTEKFLEEVAEAGLTGFRFRLLWPDGLSEYESF